MSGRRHADTAASAKLGVVAVVRPGGHQLQCEWNLCGRPASCSLLCQRQALSCALPALLPSTSQPQAAAFIPGSQVGRDGAAGKSGINRLLRSSRTGSRGVQQCRHQRWRHGEGEGPAADVWVQWRISQGSARAIADVCRLGHGAGGDGRRKGGQQQQARCDRRAARGMAQVREQGGWAATGRVTALRQRGTACPQQAPLAGRPPLPTIFPDVSIPVGRVPASPRTCSAPELPHVPEEGLAWADWGTNWNLSEC